MKRSRAAAIAGPIVGVLVGVLGSTVFVQSLATPAEAQPATTAPYLVGVSGASPSIHWNDDSDGGDSYIVRAWSDGRVEAWGTKHLHWKGWKVIK